MDKLFRELVGNTCRDIRYLLLVRSNSLQIIKKYNNYNSPSNQPYARTTLYLPNSIMYITSLIITSVIVFIVIFP